MNKNQFTEDELIQKIDSSYEETDKVKLEGLQRLDLISQVKGASLQREQERLTAKYGPEHPRVKSIEARQSFNAGFVQDVKAEVDNASVKIPDFDKNSWLLHGRVLDEDLKGVKDLTICLFDENDNWIRELGFASTDVRGYFSLTYKGAEGSESQIPESQPLILAVSDQESNILYKDDEPLFLKIGQIDYREIVLTEESRVRTPPKNGGSTPEDTWTVGGNVIGENSGRALGGLTVSLYDKELKFDEWLGDTLTDNKGDFSFSYREKDYADLFKANPDIFLKVMDKAGKVLYNTRKAIQIEAGKERVFKIKIKGK